VDRNRGDSLESRLGKTRVVLEPKDRFDTKEAAVNHSMVFLPMGVTGTFFIKASRIK
jgi:hypothetical protein